MIATQAPSSPAFYLQDSRSCTGDNMMWWAAGGRGYTSSVEKAQAYTLDQAMRQFEMRGFDLPWPVDYIDGLKRPAVDAQYLSKEDATAFNDVLFYVNLTNKRNGNDAMWVAATGQSTDLGKAKLFSREEAEKACALHEFGYAWPKSYVDGLVRQVMSIERVSRTAASKSCGVQLPKRVFEKHERERLRCCGCNRFMSHQSFWHGPCAHCGADSRP